MFVAGGFWGRVKGRSAPLVGGRGLLEGLAGLEGSESRAATRPERRGSGFLLVGFLTVMRRMLGWGAALSLVSGAPAQQKLVVEPPIDAQA